MHFTTGSQININSEHDCMKKEPSVNFRQRKEAYMSIQFRCSPLRFALFAQKSQPVDRLQLPSLVMETTRFMPMRQLRKHHRECDQVDLLTGMILVLLCLTCQVTKTGYSVPNATANMAVVMYAKTSDRKLKLVELLPHKIHPATSSSLAVSALQCSFRISLLSWTRSSRKC